MLSYFQRVRQMHAQFGFHPVAENMDRDKFIEFMKFRLKQHREEDVEFSDALDAGNVPEMIDACIDSIVFHLGTLDFLTEFADEAFDEVMDANMAKRAGVKPGRPNPFGFPDLLKPEGWTAPDFSVGYARADVVEKLAPVTVAEAA